MSDTRTYSHDQQLPRFAVSESWPNEAVQPSYLHGYMPSPPYAVDAWPSGGTDPLFIVPGKYRQFGDERQTWSEMLREMGAKTFGEWRRDRKAHTSGDAPREGR